MRTLDTTQVADVLHVSPQTVTSYIRDGKLRAHKVGKRWLIAEDELSRFLTGTEGEELTTRIDTNKAARLLRLKIINGQRMIVEGMSGHSLRDVAESLRLVTGLDVACTEVADGETMAERAAN